MKKINQSIKVYWCLTAGFFLFANIIVFPLRAGAWTSIPGTNDLTSVTTVGGLMADENGMVGVKFSDNTSPSCNGQNYVPIKGKNDTATKQLFGMAALAKALNSSVNVIITINKSPPTSCQVKGIYQIK